MTKHIFSQKINKGLKPIVNLKRAIARNLLLKNSRQLLKSHDQLLIFSHDIVSHHINLDGFYEKQELDFILPDLKSLFGKKFTFIGFSFPGSSSDMIRTKYKSKYIDDPKMTNLDNWADLEKEDNKVFSSMYSVYIQKNA